MQKLRPKTVNTAAQGNLSGRREENVFSEPRIEDSGDGKTYPKVTKQDEISFRDAEDFKQLDRDSEIAKDMEGSNDSEAAKVFITRTEKKCLEDIGVLASRIRMPLDDKHQKFFEKDRKKFVDRITMPETQELDKMEPIPQDIVSKTMEIPVNITNTELDGLRSYLLQLKELITRREMAWARTTERDYSQRVEITRFKNEVNHLRMLCEKRQKDIKERDQIISAKEDEIKELQKKVQSLKNTMLKLERKEDRTNDTLDGQTNEVFESSHPGKKPHNKMKRMPLINKAGGEINPPSGKPQHALIRRFRSATRESASGDKPTERLGGSKFASAPSFDYDVDVRLSRAKSKTGNGAEDQDKNTNLHRRNPIEKVDEKLQRIEEMLHSDALKTDRKTRKHTGKLSKIGGEIYSRMAANEIDPALQKKFTLSNSKMRQEMLGAMTGLTSNVSLDMKATAFPNPKRVQGNPSALANALLAARNADIFNI